MTANLIIEVSSMKNSPDNLTIIESTTHNDIIAGIKKHGSAAHFTNGTYAFAAEMIVPTTLAGFKRVTRVYPNLPLVVAINSDVSMKALGKTDFEDQSARAEKVAGPLAKLFSSNQVIVVYYDEKTPNQLYDALHAQNLTRTLHKWGYGTAPDAPKIEGAENFERVYGFPLPNDTKPVCYDDTEVAKEPQKIIVDDLRNDLISKQGLLFDLPDELKQYSAKTETAVMKP